MNHKNDNPVFNKLIWLLVISMIVAGIVANHYFAHITGAVRAIVWILLVGVCAGIASMTSQGKTFLQFAGAARAEMRKVVWPTRPETVRTTALIMALVAIVSLFLWLLDSGLLVLIGWLTGQRG
jgi:preprotein translocase subunit SecE